MTTERTVPAFVPQWSNANMLGRFEEGNRQSETWAKLVDFKDRAMIESAAHMLRVDKDADVCGLLASLWGIFDEEEVAEFVYQNMARIAQRAALAGEEEQGWT